MLRFGSFFFWIISASELVVRTCEQSAEKRGKACRQELHLCRFLNFLCERFFVAVSKRFRLCLSFCFPAFVRPVWVGFTEGCLSLVPVSFLTGFFVGFTLCCENFSDIFLCAFEHILLLASLEIFVCSSFARNLPKGKKIYEGMNN